MRRCYRGFGLRIASDFAIPGAIELAEWPAAIDLTVASNMRTLGTAALSAEPYRVLDSQLELTVPGVARYLLSAPSELAVAPEPQAAPGAVEALLVASGLPMALWAQGGLVLHASGVVPAGATGAIALAGPRGSGKTTLGRALLAQGAILVGDDALWLRAQEGGIVAAGLPGGTFDPDAGQSERRFVPLALAAQAGEAELAALVVLDPQADHAEPQRLTGAAALAALLRHRHRPRVPALLGLEAERLALAVLLCARVPMYALGRKAMAVDATVQQVLALSGAQR